MSSARQPRGIVLVNGKAATWEEIEVENNGFYSADTFRVKLLPSIDFTAALLTDTVPLQIAIYLGFPSNPQSYAASDLTQMIIGNVDEVVYEPDQGCIELHGRDYTALLIDTKTSINQWLNHKPSDIVSAVAGGHKLLVDQDPSPGFSGKYYAQDTVRLNTEKTEWDLLTWLASELGFVVYVSGTTLHFKLPVIDPSPYPFIYTPGSAASASPEYPGNRLRLSRNLTVAKGINVEIRSFDPKTGKVSIGTYPSAPKGIAPGSAGSSTRQNYIFTKPNLNTAQCTARAQAIQQQISQHEMRIEFDMPGDPTLTIQRQIKLAGTGTAFDQLFYLEKINQTMTFDGGYLMQVSAKNISAEGQGSI